MVWHYARREIAGVPCRWHARRIKIPIPVKLASAGHLLTHRLSAILAFGEQLHPHCVRIQSAEIHRRFEINQAAAWRRSQRAESHILPELGKLLSPSQ